MYELTAMSVICRKEKGYGFVLSIYSRDHNPPNIHVAKNLNSMDIAKIAISMETPKDKKDIISLWLMGATSRIGIMPKWCGRKTVKVNHNFCHCELKLLRIKNVRSSQKRIVS